MTEIKTLVYFDLEATGLKSSGKPRISEISLVAVNTQDVLDLNLRILEHVKKIKNDDYMLQTECLLPRVLNKLTICVYPMAIIMPQVSSITGLDNYNLTGQARFDKNTGDLLNIFLERLPSPVCLVAHNGNFYDFPLLKAELEKAGVELGSRILCIDSYVGMKEIFQKIGDAPRADGAIQNEIKINENRETIEKEIEAARELLAAGEFEMEMNVSRKRNFPESVNSSENLSSSKISKNKSELTPTRTNTELPRKFNFRKAKPLFHSADFKSKKKLNFSLSIPPKSFSLINLHKHLLGCPPAQSHGAEADCLALLRITAVLGKDWLDWVQNNCYLFTDCRKMWGLLDQK